MEWGDLEPQQEKPVPKNLEIMSMEALADYIGDLRAEIIRAESMIAAKEVARDGAEGVFRK
jgi:uncharacterized small protein (DUF1192 family)